MSVDEPPWDARQREMEGWYADLSADVARAAWIFENDYRPYAPLLASMRGRVLDLGGGAGVTRHFLPAGASLTVVEPTRFWLSLDWSPLVSRFPCLAARPPFVQGVGENLPFATAAFDAVVAFWSLNHVFDAEAVLRESARVLKPGGTLLLALEEMPPGWLDVARGALRTTTRKESVAHFRQKVACAVTGRAWPLQPDHIRIRESDVLGWTRADFRLGARWWVGSYLSFRFERRPRTTS